MEAESPHRPAVAPLLRAARRSPRRRACVAWNAVSKHATWGTSGSSSHGLADRRDRTRLMQRRERRERRATLARRPSSITTGAGNSVAAVHDPVPDRVDATRSSDAHRSTSSSPSHRRRPCATTASSPSSTAASGCSNPVHDMPRTLARSATITVWSGRTGPLPVADLGHVLAELARVLDVARARVDHVLAHDAAAARRGPGHGRSRPSRDGTGPCRCSTTMSNGVVTVPSSL